MRRRSANPLTAILLLKQVSKWLKNRERSRPLPLVTLSIASILCVLHWFLPEVYPFLPFSPFINDIGLSPIRVLTGEFSRLLLSAFFHADDSHLYYNLVSLIWKGAQFEGELGSAKFAAVSFALTLLSHGLVVILSLLLAKLGYEGPMYECAIGLSSLLFAYKTILTFDRSAPTYSSIYGLTVPTKYVSWVELIVIQLLVPKASFLGHVGGILAGLGYVSVSRSGSFSEFLDTLRASASSRPSFDSGRVANGSERLSRGPADRMPAENFQSLRPRAFHQSLNNSKSPTFDFQMQQLYDMGFRDRRSNFAALRGTDYKYTSNVHACMQ
jgi:membrane associated rhomboid family serine protease